MSDEIDRKLLAMRVATLVLITVMALMALTHLYGSMGEIERLVDAGELPDCIQEAFVAMAIMICAVAAIVIVRSRF